MNSNYSVGRHLSPFEKHRILNLFYQSKFTPKQISSQIGASSRTIKRYLLKQIGSPCRKVRVSKIQFNIIAFIDQLITQKSGEISAVEIEDEIEQRFHFFLSQSTINRIRRSLGWIKSGVKYCQLINSANLPVRLAWGLNALLTNDKFLYDIEFDETTILLHQRTKTICYRRTGNKPTTKPIPKHPLKIHILGGISRLGKTPLVIFKGNLNSNLLIEIFSRSITPWIEAVCQLFFTCQSEFVAV